MKQKLSMQVEEIGEWEVRTFNAECEKLCHFTEQLKRYKIMWNKSTNENGKAGWKSNLKKYWNMFSQKRYKI